jgi:FkbM family methyltransferase
LELNSSQPLVAIGVLAYNRPEEIKRALRALCNQNNVHLEIHVSDDCSPDPKVSQIIEEFSLTDSRVKFYRQEKNLGIIGNHQFLMSKMSSNAKYMMWACDDDDWHPDYIKVCVEELEKHPEAILCSTQNRWVENGLFCEVDYDEPSHTLGVDDPIARYKKVLSNILWWNHSFYGVVRKSAADKVPMSYVFSFDIHWIVKLSLLGMFIKLPHTYFTKAIGGFGSTLQQNLDAVKARGWLSNRFPRFKFLLQITYEIFHESTFNSLNKIKLSLAAAIMISSKRMYSKSIKQRVWIVMHRAFAGLKILRVWLKIRNLKLAKLISKHGLPLSDVRYSKKKKGLSSRSTGLVFSENSSLFEAYDELLWLKKEHGVRFAYDDVRAINKVTIKNIEFYLREGYYSFLLKEVFIKETYHFNLSVPSIVIDIGTNIGVSALYFAKNSKVTKVFGFEPFPETAQAAVDNFDLNPKLHSKIHLAEFGLSNTEQSISVDYCFEASQLASIGGFKYPISKNFDLKSTRIEIKKASESLVTILNDNDEEKILKIDTEGSELNIIQDLQNSQLLSQFSCIMLEWHHDQETLLIEVLKANNFEVFSVDKNYSKIYGDTGMIYAINKK